MQDLGNQHRMVKREGRERCPPPLEGWAWLWLLWLPGLQDGSLGEGVPVGFQAAQAAEGALRELGRECLCRGALESLSLPLYPSRVSQP